jgi:Flagellar hook-length control protein FliK
MDQMRHNILSFLTLQKSTGFHQPFKSTFRSVSDLPGFKECLTALFPSSLCSEPKNGRPATYGINGKGLLAVATLTNGQITGIASIGKGSLKGNGFAGEDVDQIDSSYATDTLSAVIKQMIDQNDRLSFEDGVLVATLASPSTGSDDLPVPPEIPLSNDMPKHLIQLLWFPQNLNPAQPPDQKRHLAADQGLVGPSGGITHRTGRPIDLSENFVRADRSGDRAPKRLSGDPPIQVLSSNAGPPDPEGDIDTLDVVGSFAAPIIQKAFVDTRLPKGSIADPIKEKGSGDVSGIEIGAAKSAETFAARSLASEIIYALTGKIKTVATSRYECESAGSDKVAVTPALTAESVNALIGSMKREGTSGTTPGSVLAEQVPFNSGSAGDNTNALIGSMRREGTPPGTLGSVLAEQVPFNSGSAGDNTNTEIGSMPREGIFAGIPKTIVSEKSPFLGELKAMSINTSAILMGDGNRIAAEAKKSLLGQPGRSDAADENPGTTSAATHDPDRFLSIVDKGKGGGLRNFHGNDRFVGVPGANSGVTKSERTPTGLNPNGSGNILGEQKNKDAFSQGQQAGPASPADEGQASKPVEAENGVALKPYAKEGHGSVSADRPSFSEIIHTAKESGPNTNGPVPAYVIQQVGKQITKAVNNGDQVIRLKLKPPELGSLKIEMDVKDNILKLGLSLDNHSAKELLLSNVHELREALGDQGIKLEKIDIQVGYDFNESLADSHKGLKDGQNRRHGFKDDASASDDFSDGNAQELDAERSSSHAVDLVA